MFSSYGGVSSRSKSTTDIFRASSAEPNDAGSYEPAINYTHFRKNTNPAVVTHRRRIAAAPVPPRRSNSSLAVADPDASALKLKRVGPYLAADDDVHHEPGNVTVLPTQLTQSPGSKNFVKKLVATLERRQREHQQSATATANNELAHKKNARNTIPMTRMQEIDRDKNYTARFNSEQVSQTLHRLPATQLEDLHERDENEDDHENEEEEEEEEDWYDSADLEPQFWREREEKTPVTSSLLLPIHIIERKSADRNNNPSKSVKRTIKSMLSSFLNWKNSNKSLPKGSREYYAARESLGEEMRAFRRDTMPRLMERATVKAKLDRNNRSDADELGSSRDDQREFSQLIGSPIQKNSCSQLTIVDEEPPSIATIHPVYGSSSSTSTSTSNHQRRSWHKPADFPDIDENKLVYGSIKVQPPTPPPRASQLLTSPASSAELIRPSRVKELQKSISRESCYYSQVQLRRPPASTGNNDKSDSKKRNSIVYDVPRSNRRVEPAEDAATTVLVERKRVPGYISRDCTPPEYENVSGIIGARDDDKRLHCTAFTTF